MNSAPARPGALTEQVNLLRQLERASVTFLREYHELPADPGAGIGHPDICRLRNAKSVKESTEYVYYGFDFSRKVWTQISEPEFELELERRLAKFMEAQRLGPYAGGK